MDIDTASPSVARFDTWVDGQADRLRAISTVDRALHLLTESANHSLLWHAMNAARLVRRNDSSRRKQVAGLTLVLGLESALVNGVIKRCFQRSRPLVSTPSTHRLRTPKTTSFPSGHATSAFCAALCLSRKSSVSKRTALLALASAVSYSRIHVRLHHASDVIGGAVLGLALGAVAQRSLRAVDD